MTDIMQDILDVVGSHNTTMNMGLRHGEQLGMARVSDEISRLQDAAGISGERNAGYRQALMDVRAFILASLK